MFDTTNRGRRLLVLLALGVPAAGCGGSDGAAPAPDTTVSIVSSVVPPLTSSPSEPDPTPATGCPAVGDGVPDGVDAREIVDVDGDGRADTGWWRDTTFGITTASGATFETPVRVTGAGELAALVGSAEGESLVFTTAGRTVDLFGVRNCEIVPITNAEGTQYEFDLGFRGTGTGVGCLDLTGDGVDELVGLNTRLDQSGQPSEVVRTVIDLNGTSARGGAVDTVAVASADEAAVAQTVTCGDLTLADDGIPG